MNSIILYILGCIALLIILFVIYFIIPILIKYFIRYRFINKTGKKDYIYLTFDDGPHPQATIEVLNILKKYNVPATFFLIGENAEKYPSVVEKIIDMDHAIGEHSYEHTHAWRSGPAKTAKDLLKEVEL